MRNAELFNTVADLLDLAPELHKQDVWESECGTQACIAGWACILGTDDFKYKGKGKLGRWVPKMSVLRTWAKKGNIEQELEHELGMLAEGGKLPATTRVNLLTGTPYYHTVAEELLGLTSREAQVLFDGSCGPQDGMTVAEALREIAKGEPIEDVWDVYDYDDE
jgi:hypothetical protein